MSEEKTPAETFQDWLKELAENDSCSEALREFLSPNKEQGE